MTGKARMAARPAQSSSSPSPFENDPCLVRRSGAEASALHAPSAHDRPAQAVPFVAIHDALRVSPAVPVVARRGEVVVAADLAELAALIKLIVVGSQAHRREYDSEQAAANAAEGFPARQVGGRVLG